MNPHAHLSRRAIIRAQAAVSEDVDKIESMFRRVREDYANMGKSVSACYAQATGARDLHLAFRGMTFWQRWRWLLTGRLPQ